jgi:hypothetical protein
MSEQQVDYRAAHLLDSRALLSLLPHLSQTDLTTIRREWARFIESRRRQPFTTWQDAWNTWTGATPRQPGQIMFTPDRCPECHGRGFSHRRPDRNLARTGHPMGCFACGGNRRGRSTRQVALYARGPEPTNPTDEATS